MCAALRITRRPRGKSNGGTKLLKNRILLGKLLSTWRSSNDRSTLSVDVHYNHVRYHESIDNVTPADVYFGRADMIIAERRRIKLATISNRRLQHRLQAA